MSNPDEMRSEGPTPMLATRQSPTAPPVVTAPNLPAMEKVGQVKKVLKTKGLPMMESGVSVTNRGKGRMPDVQQKRPRPSPPDGTPQKPKDSPSAGSPSGAYVRLQIHVENGKLSAIGIREVSGPLSIPTTVARGYAYEILMGDQQIALGSLPDVGMSRSFANRDVTGPEGQHRFIPQPSFDFFARIPKNQLTAATLPYMTVMLHNVQEAPDRFTSSVPLQKQAGVMATEVGRMSGITLRELPKTIRLQLEQILKDNAREETRFE